VLGIAGIAFATTWLRSDDTQWRLTLVAVSLTAVLAGLSSFVVAIFVEAFREFYFAIIQREEIS